MSTPQDETLDAQIRAEPTDGRGDWKEFLCRACGFIYNEGDGDPDSGLPPGTRFEDIPEDWYCPVCGVRKQDFEPYERAEIEDAEAAPVPAAAREGGVVVIGAGLAGWAVATEIRARDTDMPITMVTACNGDVYHKPELAVAFSRNMSPQTLRRETGRMAAQRLGVRLVTDAVAVGLSTRFRKLRTTAGTIGYDHLVIATGARARIPQEIDPALCWRVNDLRGWTQLHAAIAGTTQTIAIVGAGMVGCELAEDLARSGHAVKMVALSNTPMAGFLPEPVGARVREGLESLGVDYRVTTGLAGVERTDDKALRIRLADGGELSVDQVIVTTGVAPKERLFRSARLAFEHGLTVDPQTLRTSDEHVFALGDCIALDGVPCRFVEPIARQAATIAGQITGEDIAYVHRAPVIRLKTRSAPVMVEGLIARHVEWRMVSNDHNGLVMEQWQHGARTARVVA